MAKFQMIVTVEASSASRAHEAVWTAFLRSGFDPSKYQMSDAVAVRDWPPKRAGDNDLIPWTAIRAPRREPGLEGKPDIEGLDASDPKAWEVDDDV